VYHFLGDGDSVGADYALQRALVEAVDGRAAQDSAQGNVFETSKKRKKNKQK
jgi:hypothetical protein